MGSFGSMSDDIKLNLETQLKNIELQDKESQRLIEREKSEQEGTAGAADNENHEAPPKVDTY